MKTKIKIIALVVAGIIFSTSVSRAETIGSPTPFSGQWNAFTYVFTLDKTAYAPGESITVSASVYDGTTASLVNGVLTGTINGSTQDIFNIQGHTLANNYNLLDANIVTFAAPTTSGNYNASFTGTTQAARFNTSDTKTIPYTVTSAPSAPSACPAVNKTAVANYSCPSGESLNGTVCSYASTVKTTGGAVFDKPIYSGGSGLIDYLFNKSGTSSPTIYGYTSRNSFSDNVPVYVYPPDGSMSSIKYDSSIVLDSYASSVDYGGMKAVRHSSTSSSFLVTYSAYILVGYVAPAQGTYGATTSYSCKSSDTLSADKTTCTHPATPAYACSNVCSSLYNNAQGSFTSADASCATPTGAVTYSLNCSCGVSATKTNLASINSSSCIPACTAGPINGVCGSVSGTSVPSLTASSPNLCQTGGVLNFTEGAGPWAWICQGQNGSLVSPSCTALKAAITYTCVSPTPVCGPSDTGIITGSVSCVGSDGVGLDAAGRLLHCGADCIAKTKDCSAEQGTPGSGTWREVAP